MAFNIPIEETEKAHGIKSGGDWFKIEEGANKVRILTTFAVLPQHFSKGGYSGVCIGEDKGCPGCKEESTLSIKWLCWILDYKDNKVKLAKLPHTVAKAIKALQDDPDYSFEDAPIPYDTKINAKNAGTKEVEYSVVPSPKREEVSAEILEQVKSESAPEEIVQKMKDKVIKNLQFDDMANTQPTPPASAYPEEEAIKAKDIPF